MHILGHNPAVWAIVCIGLQGEFFDGREPVATIPQTVKSLCICVIPGFVMLTRTVLDEL